MSSSAANGQVIKPNRADLFLAVVSAGPGFGDVGRQYSLPTGTLASWRYPDLYRVCLRFFHLRFIF